MYKTYVYEALAEVKAGPYMTDSDLMYVYIH